jgi:hypothetical protein
MTRRINWLNSIREWQSEFVNSLSAREFVDCITDDLLGRGVFVFTPSGEVMRLPKVPPTPNPSTAQLPDVLQGLTNEVYLGCSNGQPLQIGPYHMRVWGHSC